MLPKSFQVSAIIAKLPPSWKDYTKKMVHKTEDSTLEQLQKHLRIEEESRLRENKNVQSDSKVHHLEASTSKNPSLKPNKNKGKI